MEQKIEHSFLDVRGLSLHIAHIGKEDKGTVVFLHGFPEIWYTWRHQMLAVAEAGYRAIAPDCRGYGLSEQPKGGGDAKWEDLIDDLLAILDALHIPKAFIVGKDFGAIPTYDFALRNPDRVLGAVVLGIPFSPKGMEFHLMPEGFYEPGRAETDFGRFDVKTVIRNIYILFSGSELPIAEEGQEIMDLVEPSTPLPTWFTEDDLQAYADLYERSGFTYPLKMPYRSMNRMEKADPKIEAPLMLIMGEKDYAMKTPGMEDYVRGGMMKQFVPNLVFVFMPEGTHFVHEQLPGEVNKLIVDFINNHVSEV
ncbi:uncharacterized protein LOC109830678 isoform X2 [Asparagus officinalis]|uniref:uncharacterized protein LOC109830678 isoform X2 n=1 Tax=Asparagus officinalis TaxID=4686 RepID=UPI00098E541C|nr:uncharacterized protein LOC109830678 isoform X2 [Asparagus officinalis]